MLSSEERVIKKRSKVNAVDPNSVAMAMNFRLRIRVSLEEEVVETIIREAGVVVDIIQIVVPVLVDMVI